MDKKQILFICGIKTPQDYFFLWEEELNKYYPNYDFNILGNCRYKLDDIETILKIQKKANELINKYDKTILIGHSLGGIIGGSIITKQNQHLIEKYISLVSPHKVKRYTLNEKKHLLKYNRNFDKNINTYTIGGYFDTIVPYPLTKTNFSTHKNILAGHSKSFFLRRFIIKKIIKITKN